MAKFIPLTDKNTKVVYEWRMEKEDGSSDRVTLFRDQWKKQNEWTEAEIAALFTVGEDTSVTEPETVIDEEEALDDAPLFSRDFSTPGDE